MRSRNDDVGDRAFSLGEHERVEHPRVRHAEERRVGRKVDRDEIGASAGDETPGAEPGGRSTALLNRVEEARCRRRLPFGRGADVPFATRQALTELEKTELGRPRPSAPGCPSRRRGAPLLAASRGDR